MLTAEERAMGRRFRDAAQGALVQVNRLKPTDYRTPNFLSVFRHKCPKRGSKSTAMQLKEQYIYSGDHIPAEAQDSYALPTQAGHYIPIEWPGDSASRFGFVYKEGVCKWCGQTGRSPAGRLVDALERPPITGKVARSA